MIGPSSPAKLAPRSSPNHSRLPLASRGPSQILLTAPTSCEVKQFGFAGWAEQLICAGLYVHRRGSARNPSVVRVPSPECPGTVATAALVTAATFAAAIAAPT